MPISPETPLNRGFQGIKKNKCSHDNWLEMLQVRFLNVAIFVATDCELEEWCKDFMKKDNGSIDEPLMKTIQENENKKHLSFVLFFASSKLLKSKSTFLFL